MLRYFIKGISVSMNSVSMGAWEPIPSGTEELVLLKEQDLIYRFLLSLGHF